MMMTKRSLSALLASVLVCGTVVFAQAPQASAPKPPDKPLVPLKVQVTLSRSTGDAKTSSLPFTIWVSANDQQSTTLNVGQQILVAAGGSTQYRSVGTNLTCGATSLDDGRFRVRLSIEDSSVAPNKESGGPPTFQSLTVQNYLLLRDGQNAQFVAATDKITGEVTKVEVTVTVLK
jgi:ABC-type transport system substrate-binding protein